MNSLIYSINVIVPIFIIILLGMISKRKGLIDENFIKVSSKVVFNIALPSSIYLTISKTDFNSIFEFKLATVAIVVTVLSYIVAILLSKLFCKDKSQIGAFLQGSFRGNLAIFGMAIISRTLSEEANAQGAGLLVFLIPLYNFLSVIVLTRDSDSSNKKERLLNQAKNIAKNPLIIAILLGVFSSFIQIKLPSVITLSLGYLAKMTLPLALLGIGGTLEFKALRSRLRPTLGATFIKLIIVPIIALVLAYFLGLQGELLVVIFILTGSPVAIASFAMATALNNDTELTADIITVSTLFSMITIGIGLFVFKSLSIL